MLSSLQFRWERFWMRHTGLNLSGRLATRLAVLFAPPYMARFYLARLSAKAYVDPQAVIYHRNIELAENAFIADRVIVFQAEGGGTVRLGAGSHVLRDCVLETGQGGEISIGADTFLHPRCQVMAYKGSIRIGKHVAIAPGCALYAYNHSMIAGELVKRQPLRTQGGIEVGDGAWLGVGVVVVDGVRIGEGSVIGAGSVVTEDIPDNCVAVGNPARIIRERS